MHPGRIEHADLAAVGRGGEFDRPDRTLLHKRTIAEHTENESVRAALAALGVDYAQGFAIDRPSRSMRTWTPWRRGRDSRYGRAGRHVVRVIRNTSSTSAAAVTSAPAPGPWMTSGWCR